MNFIKNFDTADLIAIIIVTCYCFGSFYKPESASTIKELALMVGTFFFAKQTLQQK